MCEPPPLPLQPENFLNEIATISESSLEKVGVGGATAPFCPPSSPVATPLHFVWIQIINLSRSYIKMESYVTTCVFVVETKKLHGRS